MNHLEELLLPMPHADYSEASRYLEDTWEVEQWNQGVWDAVTACHPDIKAIESADESYRQGFLMGLGHRLMHKSGLAPIKGSPIQF